MKGQYNINSNSETLDLYEKYTKRKTIIGMMLFILLLLLGTYSITLGALQLCYIDVITAIINKLFPGKLPLVEDVIYNAVWMVRIPRVLMAFGCGYALAISGAVMQPILNNPLASPFTLGISAGAGFGAAFAIVYSYFVGASKYSIVACSFIFSLLAMGVVLGIGTKKNFTPHVLILTGVVITYIFNAAIALIEYFADAWAVNEIVFWLVGSLSKASWSSLKIIYLTILICLPFLIIKAKDLNSMSAGDEDAKSLGISVKQTRASLMITACLLTSVVICFTGTIGFIGLISPHITRLLIGGDNRFVIPVSGLVGAMVLSIADLVSLHLFSPVILPVGVITAFMGGSLFIILMIKTRRSL